MQEPGGQVWPQLESDYRRIEQAIAYLREHRLDRPHLRDLAVHIGLSESHTQRLFSRWAGISPKRFLQFLTVEYVKGRMDQTADLLGLAAEAKLPLVIEGAGEAADLAEQIAASIVWSSRCMGEDAKVEKSESGADEAFVRHGEGGDVSAPGAGDARPGADLGDLQVGGLQFIGPVLSVTVDPDRRQTDRPGRLVGLLDRA